MSPGRSGWSPVDTGSRYPVDGRSRPARNSPTLVASGDPDGVTIRLSPVRAKLVGVVRIDTGTGTTRGAGSAAACGEFGAGVVGEVGSSGAADGEPAGASCPRTVCTHDTAPNAHTNATGTAANRHRRIAEPTADRYRLAMNSQTSTCPTRHCQCAATGCPRATGPVLPADASGPVGTPAGGRVTAGGARPTDRHQHRVPRR